MAITLLKDKKLDHNVINFEPEQTKILEEMKKVYDWKTVPMIFLREEDEVEFIGGYSDLKEHLNIDG
jgi:glutaredoxin